MNMDNWESKTPMLKIHLSKLHLLGKNNIYQISWSRNKSNNNNQPIKAWLKNHH